MENNSKPAFIFIAEKHGFFTKWLTQKEESFFFEVFWPHQKDRYHFLDFCSWSNAYEKALRDGIATTLIITGKWEEDDVKLQMIRQMSGASLKNY